MNIYSDKCPHCGTYISIPEATKCPGCISSIYWGFTFDTPSHQRGYYYFPSAESRRDAQKGMDARDVAVMDYWEEQRKLRNADFEWPVSPDLCGKYYHPSRESVDAQINEDAAAGVARRSYRDSDEGKKHMDSIAADGLQEKVRQERYEKKEVVRVLSAIVGMGVFASIPIVWIFFGGYIWDNFGTYGWSALGVGIFLYIYFWKNN
jgi:hypothetical protein